MNRHLSQRAWMVAILLLVAAFATFYLLLPRNKAQDLEQDESSRQLSLSQPVLQSSENRSQASADAISRYPNLAPAKTNQQDHISSQQRRAEIPGESNAQIFDSFFDHIRTNQQYQPEELRGLIDDFLAEERDRTWASQVETSVRSEVNTLGRKYGAGLDIQKVECRKTLCLVGVVMPASLQESPQEWQRALSGMSYENNPSFDFSNTYTTMAAANKNRVVYLSYLIR